MNVSDGMNLFLTYLWSSNEFMTFSKEVVLYFWTSHSNDSGGVKEIGRDSFHRFLVVAFCLVRKQGNVSSCLLVIGQLYFLFWNCTLNLCKSPVCITQKPPIFWQILTRAQIILTRAQIYLIVIKYKNNVCKT